MKKKFSLSAVSPSIGGAAVNGELEKQRIEESIKKLVYAGAPIMRHNCRFSSNVSPEDPF